MKKLSAAVVASLLLLVAGPARADLNAFLAQLNIEAKANLPGFSAKIGAQFGVPVPRVDEILRAVEAPADAFMCFQLGEMAGRPVETVVETYKQGRGKGWGVIAKELGIKPGSREFHALKAGDLAFTGKPGGSPAGDDGGGKKKGKGKGRKDK